MTCKDHLVYVEDPLRNTIFVSSGVTKAGDHPLKHGVSIEAIVETVQNPYRIYGHIRFPEVCHYVRIHYDDVPDPTPKDPKQHICVAVVEYTGSSVGQVVTAHYTDWLSKTCNVDEVKYVAFSRF